MEYNVIQKGFKTYRIVKLRRFYMPVEFATMVLGESVTDCEINAAAVKLIGDSDSRVTIERCDFPDFELSTVECELIEYLERIDAINRQ
jgi:hypothetical protein